MAKYESDARIIERVLAGHQEEFGELIRRHEPAVRSVVLARIPAAVDLQDVVQETFIAAYTRLDTLGDRKRFASWIAVIARNTAVSHVRTELRIQMLHRNCADEQEGETLEDARGGLYEILRTELQDLEPVHREVLLLYYFGHLRIRQVADTLGLSVEGVKKRLQRARSLLGERLMARLSEDRESDEVREQRLARITRAVIAVPVAWKLPPAQPALHTMLANALQTAGGKLTVAAIAVATFGFTSWLVPPTVLSRPEIRELRAADAFESTAASDESVPNAPAVINEPISTGSGPDRPKITTVPASYYLSEDSGYTAFEGGPGVITGHVQYEDGRPAPSVLIEVTRRRWDETKLPNKDRLTLRAVTDSMGDFTLKNLPADQFIANAFTKTHHAIKTCWLGEFEPRLEVTMILQKAGSLSGQIVDEAGNPIAGALVLPHFTEHENRIWTRQHRTLHGVVTDAAGRFTLEHLWAEGKWSVLARAPGYESEISKQVPIETSDLRLQLVPGGVWKGRMLYADNNEPVTGVDLYVIASSATLDQFKVTTDAQGEFTVCGMRFGDDYRVGRLPDGLLLDSPDRVHLTERGGTIRDAVFVDRLTEGAGISGQIKYSDTEAPVSEATIHLEWPMVLEREGAPGGVVRFTQRKRVDVDEHGMYKFIGLSAGKYRVCAQYPDYRGPGGVGSSNGPLLHNGEPAIADFTLEPGEVRTGLNFTIDRENQRRISGRVIDSLGNPVHLATVCATPAEGGFCSLAYSGDDGSFAVEDSRLLADVYIQAWTWAARRPEMRNQDPSGARRVELASSLVGPLALVSSDVDGIVLEVKPPCTHLEGTVVDEEGSPLTEMSVQLAASLIPTSQNTNTCVPTDSAGRFEFEGLLPGTYNVYLSSVRPLKKAPAFSGTVQILDCEPVRGVEFVYHPEADASTLDGDPP